MADFVADAESVSGQWGTVQFEIPDFLENIRDAINDFATLLITALEIINLALEFIKAFLKAFLDPLVALIEAIINEILAILNDLRQIGVYITGDWALLGWPPEDLRGGFAAYERRMVARLTDRTDPTRPEVSSRTSVIGFFGYVSVDPSDFERLVNFIITILKLFGISFFPDTSRLPIPTIQDTLYGTSAVSVFNFASLTDSLSSFDSTPPQQVRVTWTTSPASEKHPLNPFPVLGPSGYIVTVSTIPDGIPLKYARPRANTDKKGAQGNDNDRVQPREYGTVLDVDGQPVVLHGGAEMLAFRGSRFAYNDNMRGGVPRDGGTQVFGFTDPASNTIIPLEDLGNATALGEPGDGRGSEFFLQRTFLIESQVALAQWFAGEYSTVLSLDDMPHNARWEKKSDGTFDRTDDGPATHYYARVWAVGKQVADGTKLPQWDFSSPIVTPQAAKSGQPFIIDMKCGTAAVGRPSQPRKLTYVNANTEEYLRALQTALLVLVLSRADLPLLSDIEAAKTEAIAAKYASGEYAGQGFALRATGLEVCKDIIPRVLPNPADLEKSGQDPVTWRTDLWRRIRQMALDIYEFTGPLPDVEAVIVDSTPDLREATWGDILSAGLDSQTRSDWEDAVGSDPLLFDALDPRGDVAGSAGNRTWGICPNIMSAGLGEDIPDGLFQMPGALVGRESEFVTWNGGELDVVYEETSSAKVQSLLSGAPEGLRAYYEKFIQDDGSLLVPESHRDMLDDLLTSSRVVSSGDYTPVFLIDGDTVSSYIPGFTTTPDSGFLYLRYALRAYAGGALYNQSLIVLQAATAAMTRPPEDGEWIAVRLFDAFPELDEFLAAIENWVRALAEALNSIVDAIVRFIEFLQAQIVELQQLIARINALIQSFLSFVFALPQFSGLMLLSEGTDNLMGDFITATNKPSDSPLSYGGGVALVIPFGPSFILDLIQVLAADGDSQDLDGSTGFGQPPAAIGIEEVQPGEDPDSEEPDVL